MRWVWIAAAAVLCAGGIIVAQEKKEEPKQAGKKVELTFEDDALGKEWQVKGTVKVSGDQKHGGEKALYVGAKSSAKYVVSKEDVFGTVTMWIWDNGYKAGKEAYKGPQWGLVNEDGDMFFFSILFAKYLGGDTNYGWMVSLEPYSRRHSRAVRADGWHKFVFNVPDEKTLTVQMDGKYNSATDTNVMNGDAEKIKFNKGFTGLWFYGGEDEKGAPLYVDDIVIETK